MKKLFAVLSIALLLFGCATPGNLETAGGEFFDYSTGRLVSGARARAGDVNSTFDAIQTGLEKLPSESDIKRGLINYASDTGAADAYVVSLTYAPTSYVDGMQVVFKPANTNTGASTLNVNSLGTKNLTRQDGSVLLAGDIPADSILEVRYNSTSDSFEVNGSALGATGTMASQNASAVAITGGTIDSVAVTGGSITGSTLSGTTTINGTLSAGTSNPDTLYIAGDQFTATPTEINAVCDGNTATAAEITSVCDGNTATAAEITSVCDGNTATAAEITSVCDGNTATAAEITSVCDGNTATAAEISELNGQGAVAADFAKLHAISSSASDIDTLVSSSLYTSFSPGGDLTGTIYLARVGRLVTMTWANLTHASDNSPSSSFGILPSGYRPYGTDINNIYFNFQNSRRVYVSGSGIISFYYYDYTGTAVALTGTGPGTVSWVSEEATP